MNRYFCDLAFVEGGVRERVLVTEVDGRFASVEPEADRPDGSTHLPGLTIPGLANAHSHAFHRALRSRTQADRGSFWTWRDLMYLAAERLDPENYFRLARATFAEMTLAGFTSVGEFHYVHHQQDGTPYDDPNAMGEALLAAAGEAGIRITLLDTLYLHGGLGPDGHTAKAGAQLRYSDRSADVWVERVELLAPGPNQRIGAAIHSVRAVDPASMKIAAEWADHRDAPLHAHVSEQRAENEQCRAHHGATPTGVLHEAGALNERFSVVHATHVTPDDVRILAECGSTVCLCPTTERDLGDGLGPTGELARAGVAMTLGSDSHAVIDPFEECRGLEVDERLRSEKRGIHSATELLAMATGAGHRSLGWADAGTLREGDRADLVTVDLDSVRTAGWTAATAVEAAVFAATATDVTTVIIDGSIVVEDRHHRGLDVTADLQASISELMD